MPAEAPSREEIEAAIAEALVWRTARGAPDLPAGAVAKLAEHARRMIEANRVMNLTRITAPRELAVKHVLDSLVASDRVDFSNARVLDVGTGAGFPGIPIAVAVPSATVAMIDGTAKKVSFVDDVVAALGLTNAVALHGRAEAHLLDARYDLLVARAVGALSALLPMLLPRRDRFAALVAMKGPGGEAEWDEATRSGAARGFELAEIHRDELPDGAGRRTILVIAPTGRRRMGPPRARGRGPEGPVARPPRPA